MEEIMRKLSEMTMYGSIAIVMVLVFRSVFRRIPKKITCLFWVAVAIRLLCPFNFSMGFGIANLFESENVQVVTPAPVAAEQPLEIPLTAKAVDVPVEQVGNVTEHAVDSGIDLSFPEVALIIWVAGFVIGLGILIVQYIKIRRLIREGKYEDGIILSDKVNTPFVAGIIKPVIVLPSIIDRSEREYLICHERVHIKNKDNLTRALGLIIVCIHWFNPLVWIAYKLMCNDLEMRVDEEVIDRIGNEIKKDYCMSIVNHAMTGSRYKVYGASFAKKTLSGMEVKMRIDNLIRYKKVSKIVAILIVVASLGSTMVLSSCAKETEAEPTTAPAAANDIKTSEEPEITETTAETEAVADDTTETSEGTEEPEKKERKIDYTFRFSGDNDNIDEIPDDAVMDYLPVRMYGPVDSKYCKSYGDAKTDVQNITLKEYKEHMNEMIVMPEYYEGTDFYDLALAYYKEGYAIADIEKAFSLWGGSYFAEGFLALDDYGILAIVRADKDTVSRYIREDCIWNLVSYDESLIDNGDGTSILSIDYVKRNGYEVTEAGEVPIDVDDHTEAILYNETGIAVIDTFTTFF